jgi:hypothetical protein
MATRPALLVFLGGLGGSHVEEIVGTARAAAALDSIETALSTGAFDRALIVADSPIEVDLPEVSVDVQTGSFHFGRRLAVLLRRERIEAAVYLGGGSVPLLCAGHFRAMVEALERGVATTNNVYSSDLVAFPVSEAVIEALAGLDRDNALARALVERAGLAVEAMPRTLETQMDIDGPTDLAVLSLTGFGGRRLHAYLGALELDVERYRRVLPFFLDTRAQVLVAGRVGSHAWQYLERETACRVRMFAEERGMEAEGRVEEGSARSLLAFHLEAVGVERFFDTLAELGNAAFIDTRVLLAHRRADASRADRFLSDLGRWAEIADPFLHELTRCAFSSRIPVLLGGHSLVSGGLMALNEYAWQQRDAGAL